MAVRARPTDLLEELRKDGSGRRHERMEWKFGDKRTFSQGYQ
jgi:hypothetical protein